MAVLILLLLSLICCLPYPASVMLADGEDEEDGQNNISLEFERSPIINPMTPLGSPLQLPQGQPNDEDNGSSNNGNVVSFGFSQTSEYPFSMGVSRTMPILASGVSNPLYFELTNVSGTHLDLWEVVLESSGADFPFEVNATRIKGVFSDEYTDERGYLVTDVAFYPMRAKTNLQDGAYELNFTIRYKKADKEEDGTIDNNVYEQKLSYSVNIKGDPANREGQRVMIAAAPIPTQMASYGSQINLQIGLINRGFDPVDIISVTPQISGDADSWPFEIEQMDYSKAIGQSLRPLAPGAANGSQTDGTLLMVDFGVVTVREDIGSGYKELKFTVKHKTGNLPIEETAISIYIDIAGNPNTDAKNDPNAGTSWPQSKPRLMCTGFETEPKEVKGGDNFKLTLHLKNTSALTGIQNIRLEVGSDAVGEASIPPFLTESGANSFYIPWIGAEEEYDLEVMMTASSQVPQKIYPLSIGMEYEDWQASSISAKESVSIQLRQEVRVDHGKIEIMPPEVTQGQEANIMFPVYNKGKTTLYNVTVTIPDGQSVSAPEFFIGNINPGATANVDMMVSGDNITQDPEQKQIIQLNYEDENGQVDHKEFEFSIMVTEPMTMDDMGFGNPWMDDPEMNGEMDMEPQEGMLAIMPLWAWILLGVAVLILIILLISTIRKKRKKRKMKLEDEAYFKDLMQ
ncbi:MAG: hypothetical protein Q4E09_04155 [Eubacteriales bacterium]|nr:hypothetical protein [Eubacteriales bacterium]